MNKKIDTPEELLSLFEEYEEWVEATPILKHDFVGKDGMSVHRELQRPKSFDGFEIFLAKKGLVKSLQHYGNEKLEAYKDFQPAIEYIRMVIKDDHITGGMAGIYNPQLTQRLHGLVDKTENKHEVSEIKIIKG